MYSSAIIFAAAVLATAAGSPSAAQPAPNSSPVVSIVATADQKFVPDRIVLQVGKPQTLRFTSTGGLHGVESKQLGLASTRIAPDKPVSVSVTAKRAGTYKVLCTIVCGPGHADMALTVDVKP